MWISGVAMGISVVVLFLLMSLGRAERVRFGFLSGAAFWAGIPLSIIFFVAGFFRINRRHAIATMVVAVISAIAWFCIAFFSMALIVDGG
jgi:hypothetical protein